MCGAFPQCGQVVCHVKEDANKVFCVNTFCDFQDFTTDIVERRNERFDYMAQYGSVFFYENSLYPCSGLPFIAQEDIAEGHFFIRIFEIDPVLYDRIKRRGGSWQRCYKKDCRILVKYYSKVLLSKGGWTVNKDPQMP